MFVHLWDFYFAPIESQKNFDHLSISFIRHLGAFFLEMAILSAL